MPRDITAYEELRSAALASGSAGSLPRGLAAWRAAAPATPQRRASEPSSPAAAAPRHGALPTALAAIVLRLTQEAAHA